MKKKVCTLYLQRNLPDVTNEFGDHFLKWNNDVSDFYVIESGSDDDRVSKFKDNTFHATWPDAVENGLRWCRGFNYGLLELKKLGKEYEFIALALGDSVLFDEPTIEILLGEMEKYPKIGIISPGNSTWGDDVNGRYRGRDTIAHWLTPQVFWMFRTAYIDQVVEANNDQTLINYFYDGNNFRGYDCDTELILRAYQNGWFYAITRKVSHRENQTLTATLHETIKTDTQSKHQRLMWSEGMAWLKKKYGFDGKNQMRQLTYSTYLNFFSHNPNLQHLMM
jgi:hypothetical protein